MSINRGKRVGPDDLFEVRANIQPSEIHGARALYVSLHKMMLELPSFAAYDFGVFYNNLVTARVWKTAAEMAMDMNISPRSVTEKRRLASKVPKALADYFGRANVTDRFSALLERPLNHYGVARLIERTALVPIGACFDEKVSVVLRIDRRPAGDDYLQELVAREGLEGAREQLTWFHAEMTRRGRERPHVYVWFYRRVLDGHIWPTLDALAREVKVPAARVRKALFLAKFPEPIIDLFFHERLTPKLTKALSSLADVAAEEELIFRAGLVPEDASLSEKLTALVEGVQGALDQRAAEGSRKEDCSPKPRKKHRG